MASRRIMLHNVRFSYAHVFEPTSINGGDEKYSVCLLIPKDAVEDIKTIKDAINKIIEEEGPTKWGAKLKPGQLKLPLRDGDEERDGDEYEGHYFMNANGNKKPGVVDENVQPIIDPDEFYSGCYGRASVTLYPFNWNGKKGIACGLGNLQKLRDGENLTGGVSAVDEFAGFGEPTSDRGGFATADDDDFLA